MQLPELFLLLGEVIGVTCDVTPLRIEKKIMFAWTQHFF
jgi:hypothetical protein